MIKETSPSMDGFYMPGEYELHRGTIMIWPQRPGSWIYGAKAAREVFAKIICSIALSEEVYVLCQEDVLTNAYEVLENKLKELTYHYQADFEKKEFVVTSLYKGFDGSTGEETHGIHLLVMESDDAWARDVGPTFVINGMGDVRGIDWSFNAWGGHEDGLYASWDKDDKIASTFCSKLGYECYDAHPFVLEGGSIHADGEGTLIVTESCLLSKGRNPDLSKDLIEQTLKEYLDVRKIIWLPYGIYQDETNEHVDNVCAFVGPGEVVLAWTDDKEDPQYEMSVRDLAVLEKETDALGRPFKVHKMLIPKKPVCITEEELEGFQFEEGEDQREAGERLAASYVNFYITNKHILLPQFEDENDSLAVALMEGLFPDREVIPIYARDIIVGGGNIHCITQQIPL